MTQIQSIEAISGRATGVLFFAAFGSLWLCTGLFALGKLNLLAGILIVILFAVLAAPSVRLMNRAKKAMQHERNRVEQTHIRRVFWRVNIAQYAGIVVAILLLNLFHCVEYIVPAIAIIVGLHLFPLARLFRYGPHIVTGALLILWSVLSVVLLRPEQVQSLGALGMAGILQLSAAYTLIVAFRAFRRAKS